MSSLLQKKDFYAGLLIAIFGASVALGSMDYRLGSLMHMGPGMFPLILGALLVITGVLILGTSVATPLSDDTRFQAQTMQWRGWLCILAGPIMFIIFGELLGMAAAIFMCVFVSALGDRTATLKGSFVLAACVCVAGSALFSYALQIPLALFKWGF